MALALDFLESGGIRMEGSFEDLPLGKLLLWIFGDKYTGKLVVKTLAFTQEVHFKEGYPVGTRGGPNENYLGWLLIQRGFIDNEIYFQALTEMQQNPRLMGEILLEMGALSLDQLQRGLSLQLQKKLIRLFKEESADFHFESSEDIVKDISIRIINPYFLIPNGIRQITDLDFLGDSLKNYKNKAIRLKSDPASQKTMELVCLEEHETDALPLLETWTTIERFVEQKYLEQLPCLLLVSILDTVQLLENGDVRLVPRSKTGGTLTHEIPKVVLVDDDEDDEPQEYKTIENKPLYSSEEPGKVEDAAVDLSTLTDEQNEILLSVEEKMKIFERQDYYRWLGVPRSSGQDELREAYYDLSRRFHPDGVSGTALDFLKPKMETIFAHLTEAYSTLSKEEAREDYNTNSTVAARREQDFATKAAQAEVLYRKAMVLMKKNAWEEAAGQLKWACELNPKEGEYQLQQIWCQFNMEPEDNRSDVADEAIKKIRACKEKDASMETISTYTGRIYKSIGRIDKALYQFKEVINLNPHNTEAKREIRYLSITKDKESNKSEGLWGFLTKKR
jgi:hypothetical protein